MISQPFLKEFPKGKVGDSVLVSCGQQRCCTDDVFRVVVANLFQRAELALTCGLFGDDVARLDVNGLAWFGADEVHLTSVQHAHFHLVAKKT